MKKLLGGIALLALAGCVHATHFLGPHGEQMVSLRCNGAALDMADCYTRAREECGGNFDVVDQNQHTAYYTQTSANAAGYSSSTQAVPERNLVVICQQPGQAQVHQAVPVSAPPPEGQQVHQAEPVNAPPPAAQ